MSPAARPNLLPVAAFVSLLILLLGATGLFALHHTNAQAAAAAARLEALDQARLGAVHIRADFKTQVQEWKNILLRGRAPADHAAYLARFEKEESAVRAALENLDRDFPALGYAAAPSLDTAPLLAEHARLGAAYRDALAAFDPSAPDAAHQADSAVRGIDRALSDQLDALAETFEAAAAAELRATAAGAAVRYETLRRVTWIVAALATFASLWLCFRASRVAT